MRMKPERLAEIERKCEINGTQMYFGEVLQALEAERERVEKLEAKLKAGCEDMADECPARTCGLADKLQSRIEALEAQLIAERAVNAAQVRDRQALQSRIEAALKLANTIEIASKNIFNTRVSDLMLDWSNELREALGDE